MSDNNLQDYTEIAPSYDSTRYESERARFLDAVREGVFSELVDPDPSMSLLDVGTGTGSGVVYFGPKVQRMVGLDGTEAMLEVARKKVENLGLENVTLVCENALAIPFEDDTFDAVMSLNFIHLFASQGIEVQARFVDEMARVVKPGGCVVVEFDNALYTRKLGNRYDDLGRIGSMRLDRVIGTYLPKSAVLSSVSPSLARLYARMARLGPVQRYAYKWVARYVKD